MSAISAMRAGVGQAEHLRADQHPAGEQQHHLWQPGSGQQRHQHRDGRGDHRGGQQRLQPGGQVHPTASPGRRRGRPAPARPGRGAATRPPPSASGLPAGADLRPTPRRCSQRTVAESNALVPVGRAGGGVDQRGPGAAGRRPGPAYDPGMEDVDAVVVGAGLAGLVAAHELTRAGKRWRWSTRRAPPTWAGRRSGRSAGCSSSTPRSSAACGVKDSFELAWSDWQGSAQFDRLDDEDAWAVRWARAYVEFAAGEKRSWLTGHGIKLPADRRLGRARRPARRRARQLRAALPRRLGHRHRASSSRSSASAQQAAARRAADASTTGTGSTSWSSHGRRRHRGARHACWRRTTPAAGRADQPRRGRRLRADAPRRSSSPPAASAPTTTWSAATGPSGSARRPAHDDHRRAGVRRRADARHRRRRPASGWSTGTGCGTTPRACRTGTRSGPATASGSCPGRRRCGSTRSGRRLPEPCLPGYDTLGTLRHLRTTPDIAEYDHSWFVLTQKIIEKEFALSGLGAEPRHHQPRTARRSCATGCSARARPAPVEAFKRHGADFVVADTLEELVARMNALTDTPLLDAGRDPGARSRRATCRSPTRTARTPRCRASATPAATSATGSAAPPRRTASSTRPPAR